MEEQFGAETSYAQNEANFFAFYSVQGEFAGRLAARPDWVRAWLAALPPRVRDESETTGVARTPRTGRTVRLSIARREELAELIALADRKPEESGALARWLLATLPVCTCLEFARFASPDLRAADPGADRCLSEISRMRDSLFGANYGLARNAAGQRRYGEYSDWLSAASCGLLDAIDRYVPGAQAARFSYFAGFWIRYRLARAAQTSISTVSTPVHQHRIGRRVERYLAEREAAGRPPPSARELCSELEIGRDAYFWNQRRPKMISMHGASVAGEYCDDPRLEHCLADAAPAPSAALEASEASDEVRVLFRRTVDPATRVMLAYSRGIGSLPDACEDYLASIQETARQSLGADLMRRVTSFDTVPVSVDVVGGNCEKLRFDASVSPIDCAADACTLPGGLPARAC